MCILDINVLLNPKAFVVIFCVDNSFFSKILSNLCFINCIGCRKRMSHITIP